VTALEDLVEGQVAGDPMSRRRWLRHSLRHLTRQLVRQGLAVSPSTVRRLLRERGYSLRANRKRLTGPPHPDRDRQFRHIASQRQRFAAAGWPVISVDAKKKELLGNFKNAGRLWCRRAEEVNAHDFRQDAAGRACPYGVYDLRHDRGDIYVGLAAETAEFAVDAIRRWWRDRGRRRYPGAQHLLVLCDAGGSNSCTRRLWKLQVQEKLADGEGLAVTVCHYPTGASKWNPVEHRLFSYVSINWAGVPLRSLGVMLACIRGTRTAAGLRVGATVLRKHYRDGIRVTDRQLRGLNITPHGVCPGWNYTIRPRAETRESKPAESTD
jgi:Rhodopirellula transposase DDE domain